MFGVCFVVSSLYLVILVLFLEAVVMLHVGHVTFTIVYMHMFHIDRGVVYTTITLLSLRYSSSDPFCYFNKIFLAAYGVICVGSLRIIRHYISTSTTETGVPSIKQKVIRCTLFPSVPTFCL